MGLDWKKAETSRSERENASRQEINNITSAIGDCRKSEDRFVVIRKLDQTYISDDVFIQLVIKFANQMKVESCQYIAPLDAHWSETDMPRACARFIVKV